MKNPLTTLEIVMIAISVIFLGIFIFRVYLEVKKRKSKNE